MRCAPLILLFITAGAPAAAQELRYQDVLAADHEVGPRLTYRTVVHPAEEADVPAFYGDRFEWRPQRGADAYNWDVSAQVGGSEHRLWIATTGDGLFGGALEYVEAQALYSRRLGGSGLVLQAGLRQDFVPRPRRSYAVLGVQGNLTQPLYVGAFGFLSHKGEFTGRLFGTYDIELVPNRLILQPAFETEIAAADVPGLGIGAGPVYVEAGLRLRYRLQGGFAPYVGVNWERLLGRTAQFARDADEGVEATNFVVGLRAYLE